MRENSEKTIWIDLDNSPHVPFFSPIKKELINRGYRVVFTARDCFQVCGLADLFGLNYEKIGRHYGKNKALKVAGTLIRSLQLLPKAIKIKPLLSVSHGSRAQFIASALLKIPHILIFDYEHAMRLPLIKPVLGIAPEVLYTPSFDKEFSMGFFGYAGLKEDVYVAAFKPDPQLLTTLNLSVKQLIVTIRPPATEAHYHNPESEGLFVETIEHVGSNPDSVMVILPRNEKSQKEMIVNRWPHWCHEKKIIIPNKVVNGLDLIWYSDFVISGGGTMNREAAAIGVPVYSIFRGRLGAVDKYLAENGRLTLIESVADVKTKIKISRRDKNSDASFQERLALKQIADAIDRLARMQVRK